MTNLLYLEDSYLQEFEAMVTAHDLDQNGVLLDQSVFYPGGGGQLPDTGTICCGEASYPVSGVKRGNVHIVEGDLPPIGARVRGLLDWERRYNIMRTHTAMHILCGVIWRDYQTSVTGGNMDVLSGRMDFEFERLAPEVVVEIEKKINLEVEAARAIKIEILPRETAFQIPDLIRTKINLLPATIQEVRTVEIAGLDLQADGGTHVANTREVGAIKIAKYKSKGGINKRLYVEPRGLMRYLHPVQAHERFLASGIYRFYRDGELLRRTESWAIHSHPDGEKFVRVDVDAREEEGKSILVEALLNSSDSLVRFDIRYENDRLEGGIEHLQATYQLADERLQVGFSMNGDERKYIEVFVPRPAVIDVPLLVFRGGAITRLAQRRNDGIAVYVPMFEHAQLFPGVLQNAASTVEYVGEDVVNVGMRPISTRRYRYINKAASYWIDGHGFIIKRLNSFKQREICVEISNYASPKI